MAIVDMIHRVYTEEWARIAVREAANADFKAAKCAERVAWLYATANVRIANNEGAAWEKELAVNIAAYCDTKLGIS